MWFHQKFHSTLGEHVEYSTKMVLRLHTLNQQIEVYKSTLGLFVINDKHVCPHSIGKILDFAKLYIEP